MKLVMNSNIRPYIVISALFLSLIFAFEVLLIEIKYYIFTGGMLQSDQLSSFIDRIKFFALYLVSTFCIFTIFLSIYNMLHGRFRPRKYIIDIDCVFWFCFLYGVWVAFNFQLHQYFSDAVDAKILTNIAGGSLWSAVRFASSEIMAAAIPIVAGIFVYYGFKKILLKHGGLASNDFLRLHKTRTLYFVGIITAMAFTSAFGAYSDEAVLKALRKSQSFTLVNRLMSNALDFDMDGASWLSMPPDPAPFDGSIYFGAVDIPGNGIDENGVGGDLSLGASKSIPPPLILNGKKPKHIAVIVIESARADAISVEIEQEPVMPFLRSFGADGHISDKFYSHVGFTAASLNSLFGGTYVASIRYDSIFKAAKKHGWVSAVLSGQDESWGGLDKYTGHREVSEFFYDPQEDPDKRVFPSRLPSGIKLASETVANALESYVQKTDWSKNHFTYINLQAAHFPYYHHKMPRRFIAEPIPRSHIKKDNADWIQRNYWNALSYEDQQLERIVEIFKEQGLLDDTLLVIIGDHGEELFEEDLLGHGHAINRRQLNSLFVSSSPDLKVTRPFGPIDLHAFLYELISNRLPASYDPSNCVYHFIGHLRKPAVIGQSCGNGLRYSYNTREGIYRTGAVSEYGIPPIRTEKNKGYEDLIRYYEKVLLDYYGR